MRAPHRSRPIRGHRFRRSHGFILPVAFGASFLLLLGSLSLQTLVLQSRLGLRRREVRGLQEDALTVAAHRLVASLNRDHPCLLALPLRHWSRHGLSCASAQQQALLLSGEGDSRWRLVDWQPGPQRAEALIDLDPAASELPARRGRFVVRLLASPLRAQPPGLVALPGVAP